MEPFPPPTEEEEEDDDEEEDWLRPQPGGGPAPPAPSGHSKPGAARSRVCRVVVHVDLDCFYAQVEMIRNPELKEKPLGVQQKNIVVTCNYEARKLGVKKLMAVRDAKEKCPQLVLVNGEDLTPYREMSYKVTELLGEFCPLVERLGFDENFVDITEIVEKKLKQLQPSECSGISVSGHVYNNQALNLEDKTHLSLILGSQLAEEFRGAIYAKLGLTGCAGVASNKLLAKLVSGTYKPNQQTVLLPESSPDLLGGLENIQKLPGIGYKTTKRLEMLGVKKVCDLQALPSPVLEKELGVSLAHRIQKLSWGEDESPVVPSGPPQSFSDEDSFKRCSSEVEVKEKIQELLPSLLDRIHRDGRQPHTVRLSIRRFSSAERWWHRESRQCPVPPHLLQRLGKDSSVLPPLIDVLMKLFRKMLDGTQPFHLTLLSICFSNLKAPPSSKKGSIGFYLKPRMMSSPPPSRCAKRGWEGEDDDPQGNSSWNQHCKRRGPAETKRLSEGKQRNLQEAGMVTFPHHLWPAVDQEVFRELPEDIQKELLSGKPELILPEDVSGEAAGWFPAETHSSPPNSEGLKRFSTRSNPHLTSAPQSVLTHNPRASSSAECPRSTGTTSGVEKPPPESQSFRENELASLEAGLNQTGLPCPVLAKDKQGSEPTSEEKPWSREGVELPPHVDTKTFHELPLEVQEELLAEWKNLESHVPQEKPPGKPKGRRTTPPRSPQANSLLRYFKPQ